MISHSVKNRGSLCNGTILKCRRFCGWSILWRSILMWRWHVLQSPSVTREGYIYWIERLNINHSIWREEWFPFNISTSLQLAPAPGYGKWVQCVLQWHRSTGVQSGLPRTDIRRSHPQLRQELLHRLRQHSLPQQPLRQHSLPQQSLWHQESQ